MELAHKNLIEESRTIIARLDANEAIINDEEYILHDGDILILTNTINLLASYANSGITLPGWDCLFCKAFNGEAKETLLVCRACGATKPE